MQNGVRLSPFVFFAAGDKTETAAFVKFESIRIFFVDIDFGALLLVDGKVYQLSTKTAAKVKRVYEKHFDFVVFETD